MSFHEQTESTINRACVYELAQAVLEHGDKFNSMHEAWAVLKEEIEEAYQEYINIKGDHNGLWECVTRNEKKSFIVGAQFIQKYVIRAMKELAQVWAVCEKMKKGVEE
jgi:hypothetical protein